MTSPKQSMNGMTEQHVSIGRTCSNGKRDSSLPRNMRLAAENRNRPFWNIHERISKLWKHWKWTCRSLCSLQRQPLFRLSMHGCNGIRSST
eukprot:109787-Pelagomonas_calceolata.AAC.2